MKTLLLLILTLLFLFIHSCANNKNFLGQKHYSYFESKYDALDSLYIKDYIVYSASKERNYILRVLANHDSTFQMFKTLLGQMDVPLKVKDGGENLQRLSFFGHEQLTYPDINKSLILKSALEFENKYVLFPIVLNFYKRLNSFDAQSHGSERYGNYITMAVFIVKNGQVVYYKQVRHLEIVEESKHPYAYEDFFIPISQDLWDGLVKEVMRDYIARLK